MGELVETVEQNSTSILNGYSEVDTKFVGSSGNLGRTFSRTVRSTDCEVISHSKVTDTCGPCSELYNVVINRSLLAIDRSALTQQAKSLGHGSGRSRCSSVVSSASVSPTSSPTHPSSSSSLGDGGGGGRGGRRRTSSLSLGSLSLDAR